MSIRFQMPFNQTACDIRILSRACVELGLIDIELRKHGFQHLMLKIDGPSNPAPTKELSGRDIRRAQRYARRISNAARLLPIRARCLHQSLLLHTWLVKEHLPSRLQIGVLVHGAELHAHAWVEVGGHVVNDQPASVNVFTPLSRSDGSALESGSWSRLGEIQWQ